MKLSRFSAERSKGHDARKAKLVSLASKTQVLAAALEAGKSRIQIIVQPGVKPIQILIFLDLWTILEIAIEKNLKKLN